MMFSPPPLTVASVFKKLTEIAKMTGHSVSLLYLPNVYYCFILMLGLKASIKRSPSRGAVINANLKEI